MRWAPALMISVAVAAACTTNTPPAVSALEDTALANGRYRLSLAAGQEVALIGGHGVTPEGLAVDLLDVPCGRGDVNRDAAPDAALVVQVTPPGQPPAYELVLIANDGGHALQAASIELGVGVEVRGVTVDQGQVEVTLFTPPPPSTAAGWIVEVLTFDVQGEHLIQVGASKMAMDTVTGTLSYRERLALPPTAVVTVQLLEISRADAPATLISQHSYPTEGKQVPLPFALAYDGAAIEAGGIYVVRAEIAIEGRTQFCTTQQVRVITQGHPLNVDLVLQRSA